MLSKKLCMCHASTIFCLNFLGGTSTAARAAASPRLAAFKSSASTAFVQQVYPTVVCYPGLVANPMMSSAPQPTVIVGVTLASSDMTRALSRSFRIRGTTSSGATCSVVLGLRSSCDNAILCLCRVAHSSWRVQDL